MRILKVHENVMTVMVNVVGRSQRTETAQAEISQTEGAPADAPKARFFA